MGGTRRRNTSTQCPLLSLTTIKRDATTRHNQTLFNANATSRDTTRHDTTRHDTTLPNATQRIFSTSKFANKPPQISTAQGFTRRPSTPSEIASSCFPQTRWTWTTTPPYREAWDPRLAAWKSHESCAKAPLARRRPRPRPRPRVRETETASSKRAHPDRSDLGGMG